MHRGRFGALMVSLVIAGCSAIPRDGTNSVGMERVCPGYDVSLPLSPVLVFGEMHGTTQAPAFFLGAVCATLRMPEVPIVLVGLEFPLEQAEPLARYLASAGTDGDKTMLLATPFWNRAEQDGRTSSAMYGLVEALRVLGGSDSRLRVVVFDDRSGGDAAAQREARMAAKLEAALANHPDARMLVLVGNLHAKRTPGFAGDPGFQSMALRMTVPVRSFAFRGNGGQSWACMHDGCRIYSQAENPAAGRQPDWRMERVALSENYDGLIDLGPYTASLPAVMPDPIQSN